MRAVRPGRPPGLPEQDLVGEAVAVGEGQLLEAHQLAEVEKRQFVWHVRLLEQRRGAGLGGGRGGGQEIIVGDTDWTVSPITFC